MEADIVIVTHLPSFYKTRLYNRLAASKKIFVIFIASSSADREKDFTQNEVNFPYRILNKVNFQERSIWKSCARLLMCLNTVRYKHIVVNGWDLPEFWISLIWSRRALKGVAVESSVYESNTRGFKGLSKRLFLSLTNFALPSGEPQLALLQALGFKGRFQKVGGVGIPSLISRNYQTESREIKRFLFVGRLVAEKNLHFLINFFNRHPEYQLTIAGTGTLETELKQIAGKNTSFLGYVPNMALLSLFKEQQVLMLPSISEPWGLVVEEALQNGLPVIVSDHVGCHIDLVRRYGVGLEFIPDSEESLLQAVTYMTKPDQYHSFCAAIKSLDFEEFYNTQVSAYQLNWLKA